VSRGDISRLLHRVRDGEPDALDELIPLVYEELHRLAHRSLRGERRGHTLQTTAVVHEAFVRLVGVDVPWQDRVHFFAVASRTMRRVLVDHARSVRSAKRGGAVAHVTLRTEPQGRPLPLPDLVDIDRALERLAVRDERACRAIEMRYFGGLTSEEIGHALGVAAATVRGDLRLARAWLRRELDG